MLRKTRGRKRLLYIYDLCKGKKTCSAGASRTQDENLPPTDQEPDLAKRIVSGSTQWLFVAMTSLLFLNLTS